MQRTLSPEHHHSNRMAESAVKKARRLLRKAAVAEMEFQMALLDQRNTPSPGYGPKPHATFHEQAIQNLLPTTTNLLQPCMCHPADRDTVAQTSEETEDTGTLP